MPNKPWPVRAGSGKFHYMKVTSLYLTLLLQTLQVLMCLRWSQAFRNTLSTLRKRHMLAPRDAFFSVLQLQLCNTHAPTISISIHLSHNTIIIFLSYMAFLNHTQITCVHVRAWYICSDSASVSSWCNIHLFSPSRALNLSLHLLGFVEIQIPQTPTTQKHLAASLAETSHLIASRDSGNLRPCAHYH